MNIVKDLDIDGIEILEQEPLSKRTTFGIGGRAKVFLNIKNKKALQKAVVYLNNNNIPYIVIGDGTNLLITDNDLDLVFIKLTDDFKNISYNNEIVTAGAGVKLSDFAKDTLSKGYGGLEKIGSIPGSIGGACLMNAGVRFFDISSCLQSVGIMDKRGNASELPKEECGYSYRESIFQYTNDYIITHATFKLEKTDTAPLWDILNASIEKRKLTQPKGKCAGCFFKNSNNQSSGKLIEECGLKGLSVNDAYVAQEHANFIMNRGNATANDIITLANKIKEEVKKQKGVDLVFEVRIIK